jgi:hypothetical protein
MVMDGIWMGPRGHERWIKASAAGGTFTPSGWSTNSVQLNGGINTRRSIASHMEYSMSWDLAKREVLRPIRDMYSGKMGPGLIYFIDPFAADANVLPEAWAFPAQACYDGRPLAGDERPKSVATPANTLDYPAESAKYTITADTVSRSVYVPIPSGYSAWVGAHGETSGPAVAVTPIAPGNVPVAPQRLEMIEVTNSNRFSDVFHSVNYQGIEVSLVPADGTMPLFPDDDLYPSEDVYPSSGIGELIILSGLMIQILPTTATPPMGDYISGQGHSGADFDAAPTVTAYSARFDLIGMSAKFYEVGDSQ